MPPPQPQLEVQCGPRDAVSQVAISPDGSRLAQVSDESVKVWTRGGGVLWSRPNRGDVSALAWSRDGQTLAVATGGVKGYGGTGPPDSAGALELDARDGTVRRALLQDNYTVNHLAYLPDGRLQVAGGPDSTLWSQDGHPTKFGARWLFPSPDGSHVADRSEKGIQLWDGALQKTNGFLKLRSNNGIELVWSPDGARLAVADSKRVQIWNVATQKLEYDRALSFSFRTKDKFSYSQMALAWSPDGSTLVAARTDVPDSPTGDDGSHVHIQPRSFVWTIDVAAGKVRLVRDGVTTAHLTLAFWPDGTLAIAGASGEDPAVWKGALRFARVSSTGLRAFWGALPSLPAVNQLDVSSDGETLAVASHFVALPLWNLSTGQLRTTLATNSWGLLATRFSPDGKRVAVHDYANAFVWDIARRQVTKFSGVEPSEERVQFSWSPDGAQLAVAGFFQVHTRNVKTHQVRDMSSGNDRSDQDDPAGSVEWRREGLWAGGEHIKLLAPPKTRPLRVLSGEGKGAQDFPESGAAFSFFAHGQKLLLVGGTSETDDVVVQRFNVADNRVEATLRGQRPTCLAIAPDEHLFAVGTDTGVAAFAPESFAPRWKTAMNARAVDLKWSPDGSRLFVACEDGWTRALNAKGEMKGQLTMFPATTPLSADGDWIAQSANGEFVASPTANKWLRWRVEGRLLPLEAFPTLRRSAIPMKNEASRASK